MLFPIILLVFINGDPMPWAGFQDQESCESVKAAMSLPKGVKAFCVRAQVASSAKPTKPSDE